MLKTLRKEISSHKFVYVLLGLTLFLAFFLRVYRIDKLLGFYFDQGRDALVIWDLIHSHKFFLIGPTTGLPGIFRGPYYYYLIAPFYLLGKGNPVWPSLFLSFTTVLAIALVYYLGKTAVNRSTGLMAAILASFSFYIVTSSRWLSNPTPMMLLSVIMLWAMFAALERKKWSWPVISIVYGLSLFSFGSSGEFFYTFSLLIFFVWIIKRQSFGEKSSLDIKTVILSGILFFLTFAPLIFFDLKHDHILLHNFTSTFGGEKSFIMPTQYLLQNRTQFYLNLFPRIIFHSFTNLENICLLVLVLGFFLFLKNFIKNPKIRVVLLLIISPIIGLYFYQGNYTVLYEYYFTGYFLPFLLMVGIIVGQFWRFKITKLLVLIFLYLFLVNNKDPINYILSDNSMGPESISFINQKQAIDWVYKDSAGKNFNVDVYVPPVIPYAYNYLFDWLGTYKYQKLPDTNQVSLLYTLYEVDPPHPERLDAWLARQKGIGKVEATYKTGGITIERRTRIEKNIKK